MEGFQAETKPQEKQISSRKVLQTYKTFSCPLLADDIASYFSKNRDCSDKRPPIPITSTSLPAPVPTSADFLPMTICGGLKIYPLTLRHSENFQKVEPKIAPKFSSLKQENPHFFFLGQGLDWFLAMWRHWTCVTCETRLQNLWSLCLALSPIPCSGGNCHVVHIRSSPSTERSIWWGTKASCH